MPMQSLLARQAPAYLAGQPGSAIWPGWTLQPRLAPIQRDFVAVASDEGNVDDPRSWSSPGASSFTVVTSSHTPRNAELARSSSPRAVVVAQPRLVRCRRSRERT